VRSSAPPRRPLRPARKDPELAGGAPSTAASTGSVTHLEENIAARELALTSEEIAELNRV
jgi:hypothetical protein